MPTLRTIIAKHAPVLVLDAASSRIQVGVIEQDGGSRWARSEEEAGVGLFRAIEALSVTPNAIGGFVYCSGPGSILGIRTSAMALRAWCALKARPLWSYRSLELFVEAQKPLPLKAIADARRDAWHHYETGGTLHRVSADKLKLDETYCTPEGFRRWTRLPEGLALKEYPYDVEALFKRTFDADILREETEPDAFLHEDPSYVTWTPQIHRAPTAS